ncbi:PREDICTED: CD44 antigen isoform X1 [Lepidothrix coronata]|uniref:CD44 antigen n=1 Tax=Lepidothrix coronata TaxID=321398 RepID=A0A6J0H546_9PASS|nr:PREDICTED: CD44 antigen isoform X1 [Lepidothrix coronata]
MANFSLWATFGLCLLKLCLAETQFNVSCRYGGVFHVEKNGRYSLTRPEAVKLCRALNSTLATLEQLKKAHELGFETCRYGFVVGHIVIPRIRPYHLCAANHTGIYKLPANTTGRYDAYCYNETETRDIECGPVEKLDTSLLSNQDEIVIDNADGSRYNADGTRHTGGESSTSGADDENVGSGSTHETTPVDTSIRRSSPSYYGGATPVSQLPDHTSGGGEKGTPGKDYDDEVPSLSPDISFGTVADDFHEEDGGHYHATTTMVSTHGAKQNDSMQDPWIYPGWDNGEEYATWPAITDRTIPSRGNNHEKDSSTTVTESVEDVNQEKATKEPLAPGTPPGRESEQANTTDGSHVGWIPAILPDTEDHLNRLQTPLTTTVASPDGAHHKDPTQPPLPSDNEPGQGTEGIRNPTDTPRDEVLHKTTASIIEAGSTSSIYGNEGPRKGHYESTTFPGETATTKIDSQPRSARVPEWLIIVAALVALVLILAVCIAVNSRRRCGQKKKLVINNGKGAVEDRKSSALNGDISKSQEMVHLVHKERSNDRTQACDELLTVNETQNHQDLDMKTGV